MCGIFGYVGERDVVDTLIEGLKKLEYRGYDSAGVAGFRGDELVCMKEAGKVSILEKMLSQSSATLDLGIAHTRWATHGKPNQFNAHPHFDSARQLAVVHNGIVENHRSLHRFLEKKGVSFVSETDTEVVAQLVAHYYEGNILEAVAQTVSQLEGAFAIALIHRDFPDQMIAFTQESPLVVGFGSGEMFLSSDPGAFLGYTREALYLQPQEIVALRKGGVEVFDSSCKPIERETEQLSVSLQDSDKGEFAHYTLKEIFEQPDVIRSALMGRFDKEQGTAYFGELRQEINHLAFEEIVVVACGTSWHAGLVASYMIEEMARIPVRVEVASEFRYKNPLISSKTLVIAISQSGETADTIAAVREAKTRGGHVLALCNVPGSTLSREADDVLFLRAGREVGVCSTKAFISQLLVLSLISLCLARRCDWNKKRGQQFLEELEKLPEQAQQVLERSDEIAQIAKKYVDYAHCFFIGRHYMYPMSLEAALKLKEISYLNANAYPAGELKHGPIALLDSDTFVVACAANQRTAEKLESNLMEVQARGAKVVVVAPEDDERLSTLVDDFIAVPKVSDALASIPTSIAMQLFAYYIALERGTDIDQPRNLAKSVTVE